MKKATYAWPGWGMEGWREREGEREGTGAEGKREAGREREEGG